MKAICTRCQGSGLEPHIETRIGGYHCELDKETNKKFRVMDQFWRCEKCGMVANYDLRWHKCNPKKPISKLGKAVI